MIGAPNTFGNLPNAAYPLGGRGRLTGMYAGRVLKVRSPTTYTNPRND
jgi:hypothetical protein